MVDYFVIGRISPHIFGFDFNEDLFDIGEGLHQGLFQFLAEFQDFILSALKRHHTIQVHTFGVVPARGSEIVKGNFVGTFGHEIPEKHIDLFS